jgi:tetratricopeptide (TPR) repeat protein
MIVEAYRHAPYEGHIIDSLGWVFYRLGQYDKAIGYLEQASDMNPGNAVISDHLGDAYWFGGRKNEAVFQWKHALVLKEDSEMLEKDAVRKKIEDNAVENEVLVITDPLLLDLLANLKPNEENNEAKK